jgi:predicted ArsR family transcriptional regulator
MKLSDLILENEKDENRDLSKAPSQPEGGKMTTAQVAKKLGVTMGRVRQMIMNGQLSADGPVKGRRDNLISQKQVASLSKKKRKAGRPKENDKG